MGHYRQNIKISAKDVFVNQTLINHGLMRDVKKWFKEGSRLNYSVAGPN
jgi:hypothetical protein